MQVNEFVKIYRDLANVYTGRMKTDQDTLDSWYKRLSDIPTVYVVEAIDHLADDKDIDPRYPPNPIQIRRIAKQLSGIAGAAVGFEVSQAATQDQARNDMYTLLNAYYHDGELDDNDWNKLINSFQNTDRSHAAQHATEVYQRLQAM